MDIELRVLLALTRRLPTWKGAGRIVIRLHRWYLRKPRRPVEAHVHGARMRLEPAQYVDGWLLFGPQFYEAKELAALMKNVRPGDVFVDVGAHIGLYTLQAASRVSETGVVVAIEPDPKSACELRHNVAINALRNVRVVDFAAAGRSGRRTLAQAKPENRAGATLLSGGVAAGIEVPAEPLADILKDQGIARIDVAKFDIEGTEREVLSRYFDDAPQESWPRVIMTEHYAKFADRGGDVLTLLRHAGYAEVKSFGANYVFARR